MTLLPRAGAPGDAYEELSEVFTPEGQVALTMAIVTINTYNRLAVGFRSSVGEYVSPPTQLD